MNTVDQTPRPQVPNDTPPTLGRVDLPQGQRVGGQILIVVTLFYAMYMTYMKTDDVRNGMAPASVHPLERYDEQPTAVVLLGGFLAMICTAYVFITLRDCKLGYFE